MDETGHSGDTGSAGGGGAESRDRTLLNGWASSRSPWAGRDDEPDDDVPTWRRPAQEIRPFTRQPPGERPSGDVRPFPGGSEGAEIHQFPVQPSPPEPEATPEPEPAPRWSDSNRRYDDLLKHFSGGRGNEPFTPSRFNNVARPDTLQDEEDRRPSSGLLDPPTPSSAPPYPYEGDLDDASYRPAAQAQTPQTQFPSVRSAPPPGRRNEPARHALDPTPAEGLPVVQQSSDQGTGGDTPRVRAPYDPVTFPRRLPYEPPPGPAVAPSSALPAAGTGYASAAAYPSQTPLAEQTSQGLPQRVPAKPDVPTVPEPAVTEPTAETPELARIATHLRRDDLLDPEEREEGFDVQDILAAVREVEGVRDAMVRTTPAGANSLRLDLAEGADPAEVSRQVARLLQDRMGLDAAMQGGSDPLPPPPIAPRTPPHAQPHTPPVASASVPTTPMPAAFVPSQAGPSEPIAGSAPAPADLRRMPTMPQNPAAYDPGPSAGPESSEPGAPGPLDIGHEPVPRVMIDNVQVTTFGTEAQVEVRLIMGGRAAKGVATGPAVDGYLLRLCATATTEAINDLLVAADRRPEGPARCFVEHAGAVPFGSSQVAVVVLLMSTGAWVEQLAGSAMVGNDARHAMVRATLAATNRRLEALLSR